MSKCGGRINYKREYSMRHADGYHCGVWLPLDFDALEGFKAVLAMSGSSVLSYAVGITTVFHVSRFFTCITGASYPLFDASRRTKLASILRDGMRQVYPEAADDDVVAVSLKRTPSAIHVTISHGNEANPLGANWRCITVEQLRSIMLPAIQYAFPDTERDADSIVQ